MNNELTDENLTYPLRDCTTWCETNDSGNKHADMHPVDRDCWSGYNVVKLRHHEPVKMYGGPWWMDFLNVYLRRKADRDDTVVYVHHESTDKEVVLALDEAEELARKVLELVAIGRQGSAPA